MPSCGGPSSARECCTVWRERCWPGPLSRRLWLFSGGPYQHSRSFMAVGSPCKDRHAMTLVCFSQRESYLGGWARGSRLRGICAELSHARRFAGGTASGASLHLPKELLCLLRNPLERRALRKARKVGLKDRLGVEGFHHDHSESDLRSDIHICCTEPVPENVGPRCQRLFQRTHSVFVTTITIGGWARRRGTRHHAVHHRRFD